MKNIIPLLMMIAVLLIFVFAVIYISKRLSGYFGVNVVPYYISFSMLTVFMIGGLMTLSNTLSFSGHLLYILAAIAIGFMIYLLLSVFVVDFVQLFLKVQPRFYGISAIILALTISGAGVWNAYHVRVTEIEVEMKGLSKEIRAMHLTDIHIGHFRGKKFLQYVVDKTNAQNVDLVFLTGDFFDGQIAMKAENFEPLRNLNAPLYFVEGNHDEYTGAKAIKSTLKQMGVHVLENEVKNFGELQLIGLNHMLADRESFNLHASDHKPTIKEVLPKLNIDLLKPSILLHHSPDGVQYANEHGVDLYLAGHTHGGQLFPVNLVANLLFPYNNGLHDYKGTKMFVSEGVGTFGPPMRIGTKSEIIVVKLKP